METSPIWGQVRNIHRPQNSKVLLHAKGIEYEAANVVGISDYDYEILYHPSKANVVVDVLSQKGPRQLCSSRKISKELVEDMTRVGK